MAAMRNPQSKHIDFEFMRGYNPDKPTMLASDLDMVIERKGQFLVGEWKSPVETVPMGQMRMLQALAAIPAFTVLIVEYNGLPEQPYVDRVKRLMPTGSAWTLPGITSNASFKHYVASWEKRVTWNR